MTRHLSGFNSHQSSAFQVALKVREDRAEDFDSCGSVCSLYADTNRRRPACPGNRQDRVKVGIKSDHRCFLGRSPCQDFFVRGARHSEFANVCTNVSEFTQETRRIAGNPLVEYQAEVNG